MKADPDDTLLRSHWLAVARSADLRRAPLAVEVLGKRVVIGRFGDRVSAFDDRCPHRNIPLSTGCLTGGHLKCSYHGWEFDASGRCASISGLLSDMPHISLNTYQVYEHEKIIWLNLSNSASSADLPSLGPSGGDTIIWERTIEGSVEQILENFLDGTHTHYVHRGLVRNDKNRKVVRIEVRKWSSGAEVKYLGEGKQNGLISRLFENNRTESFGRFLMPSIGQVEYRSKRGVELIVSICLTPATDQSVKCFVHIYTPQRSLPLWFKKVVAKFLFGRVLEQDLRIIEKQSKSIRYFGGPKFVSTEIDVMRPLIRELWFGESASASAEGIAL